MLDGELKRSNVCMDIWFSPSALVVPRDNESNSVENVAIIGHDYCTNLWDIETGKTIHTYQDPNQKSLYSLQADNNLITRASQFGIHTWDRRTAKHAIDIKIDDFTVQTISIDKTNGYGDGWMCAALGPHLRVYDLRKPDSLVFRTFENNTGIFFPSWCEMDQRSLIAGWFCGLPGIKIYDRNIVNNGINIGSERASSICGRLTRFGETDSVLKLNLSPVCFKMYPDKLFVITRRFISILDFSGRKSSKDDGCHIC